MRRSILVVLPVLALLSVAPPPSSAARSAARSAPDTTARTALLLRWAGEALDEGSLDSRQRAVRLLDEVLRRDPALPLAWLERGRANELGGFAREARGCYAHAIELAPADAEGFLRLGMAWRREWLRWLDAAARDSAVAEFEAVIDRRPNSYEARMRLVPLLAERGEPGRAMALAEQAADLRPRAGEPALAVAYLAYRRGELERADSLFRWAIDRLPAGLRGRFEDVTPLFGDAGEELAALRPAERAAELARRWQRLDPDPTTRQNEMRLEFWSRVTHAWLMFDDPLMGGPDARAEVYVRYGPPQGTGVNPPGIPLYTRHWNPGLIEMVKRGGHYIDPAEYPLDAVAMPYPDLGMQVVLQDRGLRGRYDWPMDRYGSYAEQARPDPRRLAGRDDLIALGDGFAVFPTLPPPAQRLEVRGALAGFEDERGPRLFAQVNVPAEPGDSLTAVWVVRDTSGRERLRQEQRLATSVCDPAGHRIAELNAALPAGAFDLAVSVRDTHHRRGLYRAQAEMAPPPDSLALSDVVLTCGEPALLVEGRSIRLEADRDAVIARGAPLVAYFEIYRLAAGADGLSTFEVEYTARRLRETPEGRLKPEAAAALASPSASREETQVERMRRQFLTVPAQSLTPGRYRLEIRVRDMVSGRVARREVEFTRE